MSSVTTNVLSSGAATPSLSRAASTSASGGGRVSARHAEQVAGSGDLGHDVAVRGRGARVDESLPAVDEVSGDDRVAIAVLRVAQMEGQGLGISRDLVRFGERIDDIEVLVDVDERDDAAREGPSASSRPAPHWDRVSGVRREGRSERPARRRGRRKRAARTRHRTRRGPRRPAGPWWWLLRRTQPSRWQRWLANPRDACASMFSSERVDTRFLRMWSECRACECRGPSRWSLARASQLDKGSGRAAARFGSDALRVLSTALSRLSNLEPNERSVGSRFGRAFSPGTGSRHRPSGASASSADAPPWPHRAA